MVKTKNYNIFYFGRNSAYGKEERIIHGVIFGSLIFLLSLLGLEVIF